MINQKLITLLVFSFIFFLSLGLWSGGAHSDASDYITLSIQIVKQSDWSQLLMLTNGREVFSLWLFILVIFMKIFGPFWQVAIIVTALFGTLNIFLFYQILNFYFKDLTSFLISICLSLSPAYIVIAHNSLYDAFFIFFYLAFLYFYLKGIGKNNNSNIEIIIAGIIGSFLVIIHGSGYPYILFLWLFFPVFYAYEKKLFYKWIIFSISVGFIPVLQIFIWKFYIYDSFFPYFNLYDDWAVERLKNYKDGFEIRHYFRFILMLLAGYTPIILISICYFIFKPNFKYQKSYLIFLILIFSTLIFSYFFNSSFNLIFFIVINFMFIYHFKSQLIKINALVAFFGFMSIFTFYSFLSFFPVPYFHQKHFVYPILFGIPVYWYVCNELKINNQNIFIIYMSSIIIQFLFSLYFILPNNKDLSPDGFNVKYSDFAIFGLPFTNEDKSKKIFHWYKDKNIEDSDYIITNTYGRYVNAKLNMSQNRYIKIGHNYTYKSGFRHSNNDSIIKKVHKFKPRFIHWNSNRHENYQLSSYNELKNKFFNNGYTLIDSIDNDIYFFVNNY